MARRPGTVRRLQPLGLGPGPGPPRPGRAAGGAGPDAARKVVGVGSVGTRASIVLLQGRDTHDPLFLQVKEPTASVLEASLPKSRCRNTASGWCKASG